MADLVDGWPVWLAFGVLFLGAFARGNATYWVGRGLRTGGERSRWARHLDRPLVARAEGWVRRFGAPAVSLGFLTVGVQSAVNAAAGMLRMPMRRFLPAVTVGAALWAGLYTTVGLAVVDAVLGRLSWGWVLLGVAVLGGIVVASRRLAAGRSRLDRVSGAGPTADRTSDDAPGPPSGPPSGPSSPPAGRRGPPGGPRHTMTASPTAHSEKDPS